MRKITVLIGVTLLLMSGQASGQGMGDPLGLISRVAIQPFWNAAGDSTLIEVTSPLDDNGLELEGVVGPFPSFEFNNFFLHVVYYNAFCGRIASVPHRISYKGAIVFSPDVDLGALGTTAGLAVITRSFNGQIPTPIPDDAAIHVRGHWYNFALDFVHEVDPIAGLSPQAPGPAPTNRQTYSPLKSAASFVAPIQAGPFFSTLYLICPVSTVFPTGEGFPALDFIPGPHLLLGYLYDDEERKLIDYQVFCTCVSMYSLEQLSPLYGSVFALQSLFTYTELVSYEPATGPLLNPVALTVGTLAPPAIAAAPPAFTGYLQITVNVPGVWNPTGDDFGRLHNGSAYNYRVNLSDPFVPVPPQFVPGLR